MILKAKIDMSEIVALANKNSIGGQLKSTSVAVKERNRDLEAE